MVTPIQAEMAFFLQKQKTENNYLNFTGTVKGSLKLIGYGHGHHGHFIFTDSESGKIYAAAANANDGNVFIKSSGWAKNVPNYSVDTSKLSDDLDGVQLGNISSLFSSIADTLKSNVNMPFTAVDNGATATIGGATNLNLVPSLGGGSNNTGNPPLNPLNQPTEKKWLIPTIIGAAILLIGGGLYMAFVKK